MYLDEERSGNCRSCGAGLRRDEGDGSSSGTNVDESCNVPGSASVTSSASNHAQIANANRRSFSEEGLLNSSPPLPRVSLYGLPSSF